MHTEIDRKEIDAATAFKWFVHPRPAPVPACGAALLAGARRETVDHGEVPLALWHWDAGLDTDAPLALLVHGWEGQAAQFHRLVPVLRELGYRVAAPDMPAHGASGGTASSPVDFARAATVIGQALGGRAELVICHSVGSPAILYAFAQGFEAGRSVHIAGPVSLSRAVARFAKFTGLAEAERGAFLERVQGFIGGPLEMLNLEQVRHGLRHPALLVHDPADLVVPASESEALARDWSGAELVLLEEAGHAEIVADTRLVELVRTFAATA